MPKLMVAKSQRDAFRLRAEHASLGAVADRRPHETDFVVENIVSVLKPCRRDSLLEIGCGDGRFLKRVAPLVERSIALDLSPVSLSKIRQGCGGGRSSMLFSAGVSEALPFRDAIFSLVVMNGVLYALGSYEEADHTVEEVRRVLCPGGAAYWGEVPTVDERHGARPSDGWLGAIWAKLQRHGLRTIFRLLWERRRESVHVIAPDTFLYWPQEKFAALLETHNFRIKGVFPHATPYGITSRLNYVVV